MGWNELKNECLACRKCGLCETRTNVVFGVGKQDAEVLFVGEGPGENEDLQGEPFVGRGGKLLDDMLSLIDLDRKKNIYIANIVKCRPPKNRDPLPEEEDACIDYLRAQTALIRPAMLVCLGRVAAKRIIDKDYQIMKQHGQWIERGGLAMTATLHPSALLRNPNNKPDAFEDFLRLREKIDELKLDIAKDYEGAPAAGSNP